MSQVNVVELADPDPQVRVLPGRGIYITSLRVDSPEVAEVVDATPVDEQPSMVRNRLVLGFRAAELGRRARDVDSLKMSMERVTAEVIRAIEGLPEALARELGGRDGRVSAPILQAARDAANHIEKQVEQVARAVDANVGPGESALNRKLGELGRFLDPAVDGSAPKQITAAARDLATEEGPLVGAVAKVLEKYIEPLRQRVDTLVQQINADEAVSQALEQTTAKGVPYEERVLDECVRWACASGSAVQHVGGDKRPGDIIIDPVGFGPGIGRVAIECRSTNSAAGRTPVSRDCEEMMATRSARAAIYLCETPRGLAKEIGGWSEGESDHGPWIATTHECLTLALRYVLTMQNLAAARVSKREIDELAIASQLNRIRTASRGAKDVRTKTSEMRKLLGAIDDRVDTWRSEISSALAACEELLTLSDSDPESRAA